MLTSGRRLQINPMEMSRSMDANNVRVTIRLYQKKDLDQCRKLWRELTDWHRQIYDDPNIGGKQPELYFDKHLARAGADHIWVAVCDSKIVGLTGLLFQDDEADVEPVIVSESYRGRGIGEKLVQKVVAEAKKSGVPYLDVRPVARNVDAIRFFYSQGFKALGRVDMLMDLSGRKWKSGAEIHGCEFDY